MNENISPLKFAGFALLDGIYWGFYAAFFGFITTYLLACGMKSAELSIVLALFMLCAFIGAFFWGGQCDKRHTNKKVFILEFLLTAVLALLVFLMASRILIVSAVLYPLLGFLAVPLGSNIDGWMLKEFNRSADVYGKARAIGSAGYAIVMLVCGQLIHALGYRVIPFSAMLLAALVLIFACAMPERRETRITKIIKPGNPKDLLKYSSYVLLLIILFFTGIAVSPINNLKIVIIESVGGDVSILGIDAFIGVMVQAIFIFISGRLRRIPAYTRLLLMCACALAMMLLTYFAVSSYMIIMGTVMNNISYGLMLPTSRELTDRSVPPEMRNTAYSTADAMYGSFAGVIALLYSGFLMDAFGARFVALLGAVIMIIPIVTSIITIRKGRRKAESVS